MRSWLDAADENAVWSQTMGNHSHAEAHLISKMIVDARDPQRLVDSHDFCEPKLGLIFEAINDLRASGRSVTPIAVAAIIGSAQLMPGKTNSRVLEDLASNGVTILQPEDDIALSVRENSMRRLVRSAAERISSDALENSESGLSLATKLQQMVDVILDRQPVRPRTMADVVEAIAGDLRQTSGAIPTGLPSLDDALGGGLWPGKLYGLQAQKKCGKTATCGTIALHAAKSGHSTCYIALEMGEEQIAQRMLAIEFGMNSIEFLKRTRQGLAGMCERYAQGCDMPLYFVDRPGLRFNSLQAVMAEHAKIGCKLFIVDYWQLIRSNDPRQNQVQHLDDVAQWLADFAKSHRVAVLTPAQENRDGDCRFGDGLRMACSMYLRMCKPDDDSGVKWRWLEMLDSRYTLNVDIGCEGNTPLYLDNAGPRLADMTA